MSALVEDDDGGPGPNGDYVVQSMSDRVAGLVVDAERYSAQLWASGDRIAARRLEVLAKKLHIARVLLGSAPVR